MLGEIFNSIARPLVDRVVSTIGTVVGSVGATTGDMETLQAAFLILAGLISDLIIRKIRAN